VTLIRAGAIGRSRGVDPFKNLTPTGRWIGGVGITLNTTPDPDQISAWADQSGNARNVTQVTESLQPRAELWRAPSDYAVRFVGNVEGSRRLAGPTVNNFVTATDWTVVSAIIPRSDMSTAAATFGRSGLVLGDGNSWFGVMGYRASGQSYVAAHSHPGNTSVTPLAVPDDALCVVAGRLSGGTALMCRVFGSASGTASATTSAIGSLAGGIRMGSAANGSTYRDLGASIYEAAIFNTALPDADITAIAAYMLARYS